ncbi:hypothetical protein WV31_09680 [Magnetospirillum sp. ME-1]|nr:hypothetical protein WV31_09680 [Magnetospirillum sp. ME-1]
MMGEYNMKVYSALAAMALFLVTNEAVAEGKISLEAIDRKGKPVPQAVFKAELCGSPVVQTEAVIADAKGRAKIAIPGKAKVACGIIVNGKRVPGDYEYRASMNYAVPAE